MKSFLVAALIFNFAVGAGAYDPNADRPILAEQTPKELENVGITERLGKNIDLNLEFIDDKGEAVRLQKYFQAEKPVLMTVVYYGCPNLCNYHLNGLVDVFKKLKLKAGRDFEFVAVSMDHTENDILAGEKKANYIQELGDPEAAEGWHFLTGSEENVRAITGQLGFGFRWDDKQKQFAHAAAAYLLTPSGVISRILYGIQFTAQTLGLSLVEASAGTIGDIIDQVILFCFQFDPTRSKYTLYAYNIMRIGAVLAALALAIFLVPLWRRERGVARGDS